MDALDVINDAKTLLETLSYPVYLSEFLTTDANGLLELPGDESEFVLHVLTGEADHEWGKLTGGNVVLQVNAYSTVPGEGLAMLQAAAPLLASAKFVPRVLMSMPRDGPYTGYAQRFERRTTP